MNQYITSAFSDDSSSTTYVTVVNLISYFLGAGSGIYGLGPAGRLILI